MDSRLARRDPADAPRRVDDAELRRRKTEHCLVVSDAEVARARQLAAGAKRGAGHQRHRRGEVLLEQVEHIADRVVGLADSQIVFDAAPSELTDAQLERIYAGRSTTQPANAPAEPPVMLEPSLEMSR